jgi:hypothetical protein
MVRPPMVWADEAGTVVVAYRQADDGWVRAA